jgi:DNA-binding NtrC family response regulator
MGKDETVPLPLFNNDNATAIDTIIETLGNTSTGLVVSGEAGLGKEAIVRLLYARSTFRGYPFIKVNCPVLSDNGEDDERPCLGEARLHPDHGSFSLFRLFHQGVLYLHSVDQLTPALQDRLLELIKRKLLLAATPSSRMPNGILIISTATRSLDVCAAAGGFNPSLADLLSGVSIHIPPLRRSPDRIIRLVNYFIRHVAATLGCNDPVQPSIAHLARLRTYDWPGNIRELQDTVMHAVGDNDWRAAVGQIGEDAGKVHGGAAIELTSDGVALMPEFEITQRRMLELLSERAPAEELGLMDLVIYEELIAGREMH